ncbi:hypothetical protein OSC52_09460 [Clostridium pasteurianum]|uniref:hypothetical protein n=1 Tax=Clostridium pasteurianum TaxID=1501 RepID=UPI002260DDD9|nr:hypothetical protein [Clostridium pasteurianum]UZW16021.1 hypothetical protein OSC52_09460 [Clostridium pasteurianum]
MDEKEELKQKLKQELHWVKYRQKMLDIIEDKLLEMREIAEQANQDSLSVEDIEILNDSINNLAAQVRAIDSESIKMEDGKILE